MSTLQATYTYIKAGHFGYLYNNGLHFTNSIGEFSVQLCMYVRMHVCMYVCMYVCV